MKIYREDIIEVIFQQIEKQYLTGDLDYFREDSMQKTTIDVDGKINLSEIADTILDIFGAK